MEGIGGTQHKAVLATQGSAQPCESGTMSPLLSLGIATRKGFIVFSIDLNITHGGVPALLQSEGDFVSRRSSGKKEGSRLFGEEEHRLERSSSPF